MLLSSPPLFFSIANRPRFRGYHGPVLDEDAGEQDTCNGVRSFRARASATSALLQRTRLRAGAARPRTIPPPRSGEGGGARVLPTAEGPSGRAAPEDDRRSLRVELREAKVSRGPGRANGRGGKAHQPHCSPSIVGPGINLSDTLSRSLPPPLTHITLTGAEESGHGALGPGVRHEDLPQEGRSRSDAAVLAG